MTIDTVLPAELVDAARRVVEANKAIGRRFALAESCAVARAAGRHVDERYLNATTKAIKFIESQQHDDGGWRYNPIKSEPSDASVSGWSMLALKTAVEAGVQVDKGVIANLAYDRYWAGKTGKQPTPNPGGGFGGGGGGGFGGGGASLTMEGGDATLEQLIASVERGLLVTHFWYIRFVNQQTLQHTGLTRDGLFLIENGKITTPVTNLRFLESPVRLLQTAQRRVESPQTSRQQELHPARAVRD